MYAMIFVRGHIRKLVVYTAFAPSFHEFCESRSKAALVQKLSATRLGSLDLLKAQIKLRKESY